MNSLYEYSDRLNAPYECFIFDTRKSEFPIRPHWHYFMEIIYMIEGTARGVRYQTMERAKLVSSYEEIQTPLGSVQNKISSGFGITKSKLEFDDVKRIAKKTGYPLAQVYSEIQAYMKK